MPVMGWIMFIAVVMIVGRAGYYRVIAINRWFDNNRQPIERVKAGVHSKRIGEVQKITGRGQSHQKWFYYITFEVHNEEPTEYRVEKDDYYEIEEEDNGYLEYQGTRFISFSPR